MAWHRWLLRVLRRGPRADEIEREVAFHLAERADELMSEGMPRGEAMREARRRFGNPSLRQERVHQTGVVVWLEVLLADVRYAARSLRRSPAFATVAILSLGLGIGANTAIFSLYNAVVLRTLPVRNAEQLVQVTFGSDNTSFTNPLWEELRDHQDVLSHAFAFSRRTFNLADGGEVRNVHGYWVSGDFFHGLGVQPVLGRLIANGDDYRGCPAVAAVSYAFWQREFGGAADAIGGALLLNGTPFEVIGVVDAEFSGMHVGIAIDVYAPLCTLPMFAPGPGSLDRRSYWYLNVFGRLPPGRSVQHAGARLGVLSPGIFEATVPQNWEVEAQGEYRAYTLGVREAPNGVSQVRSQYGTALLVLMGLVAVVLLIACGNVANLMLARATRRQHEVAIRRAIGAGRGRLVRLLLTESLLLSALSAIVAVAFARWASAFMVGMLSTSNDVWLDLSVDGRVLAFTMAVATLTGVLFGLTPAWRATGVGPQAALRAAGREGPERQGRFSTGKLLVIGQLAMSLSLVMGAGLLIGTLTQLLTLDPGFNREGVLLVSVNTRNVGYSPEESPGVNRELLERMRSLPGVRIASTSFLTPIDGSEWNDYVEVDGYTPADRGDALVWFNSTSDSFFTTLETPFLAGRDFDARDRQGSVPVAVINETMARRFFADPQPLGRSFRTTPTGGAGATYQVIGVVADTKYRRIDEEQRPIAYTPLSQENPGMEVLRYYLRSDGPPTALIPAVAALIEGVHPRISVRFSTLADVVGASLTRPRMLAVLSGFFGAVALLLAMIGLYGTLAYRVTSRRNEIGVRLALGAARTRVLGMMLAEVSRMVLVGILVGVAVVLVSTRFLAAFLFGLTAADPTTLLVSAGVLAAVGLAAGVVPAWSAARLDPMVALREE